MSGVGRDIAAGTAHSAVSVLAGIVVTPVYIATLGREGYGVIGFAMSLQAALLALDGGVAVALTRHLAAAPLEADRLLRTLSRAAWAVGAIVAVIVAAASPWIAAEWLRPGVLDPSVVAMALAVSAVAMLPRWPGALYQAVLFGRQRVAFASVIGASTIVVTVAGSIALLRWVSAELPPLFAWLAFTAFAQALVLRPGALQEGEERQRAGELRAFLRASIPVGAIGVVGLLLLQVDKLVLSRVLPLETFAVYSLATVVAAALYAFVVPVFNAVYPRLARLVGERDEAGLLQLYRAASQGLACFLFPVAAVLAFFAKDILGAWTGDALLAADAAPMVLLLALGTGVHGIMFIPYALTIARGRSRLALAFSTAILLLSLPLTVGLGVTWGAEGGAAAWLIVNLAYFAVCAPLTHRLVLPAVGAGWYTRDIGPAALLSLSAAGLCSWAVHSAAWGPWANVAIAAFTAAACWLACLAASPRMRGAVAATLPVHRWRPG